MLADALFERWLPRPELEADTVVNHGKTAGGEICRPDQPAADKLTSLSPYKAQPALGHRHTADAGDFGLFESLQQIL
nr:hypothetical protein [Mesorhizobium sp. CO1-1-8]